MGNVENNGRCFDATHPGLEKVDPDVATFDVPNHVVLAGLEAEHAKLLYVTAARRGWHVCRSTRFADLSQRVARIPPGGMLLLDTSILTDRSGIERLTQLSELPALPRIYLTAAQMDVNVLAVREICLAASIPVQDILILPMDREQVDTLLGT